MAAALVAIGLGSVAGQAGASAEAVPIADEAVDAAGAPELETPAAPAADPAHRHPSDPRLRPSPLVAQFWVAVAVIGAGLIAALGLL